MWDRLIRIAALWAGLLLSLCILEAAHLRALPSAKDDKAARVFTTHTLRLKAAFAAGSGETNPRWSVRLLREERRPSTALGWERIYVPAGEGSSLEPTLGFEDLPAGAYFAVGSAPGYSRATARVDLHENTTVQVDFVKAGQLEVQVYAQEGEDLKPIKGATVLVGDKDQLPWGASTDDKGRAVIGEIPKGPMLVRIYARGYEPYEGMAEGSLLVRLRPASTLRVTVTDRGVVQPDARVFIAGAQLWPARVVVTGRHGHVDVTGLKPGRYALYAEKANKVSQVSANVEVLSRAGVVDVTLELYPGKYASVVVRARENEKPIAGARVTWSSVGLGQFSRHQVTEADGIVRIGPLEQLEGVLHVRASGYVARLVPVEMPAEWEEGAELQIVRLERAATIEGRVVDADGFPVGGATVEVAGTDMFGMPVSVTHLAEEVADAHFDWANDMTNVLVPAGELGVMLGPVPPIPLSDVPPMEGRRLTTDDKGYFLVRDVPPGEVVVLARHPAHMDGKSGVLKLTPGGHKETEIVLGKGKPLRGRVLDHSGFPVPGARVLVSSRGFERRVVAESDGTFELGAAPDDVTLRVSRLERPLRVLLARDVLKKERTEEIQVELPAPRESAQIVIQNAEGAPVELAQVTLLSLDRAVPFKATRFTSSEGEVEFEEAVGLRVRIEAAAPGYVTQTRERALKKEGSLRLVAALEAVGRVTAVRGRMPADGASVVFRGNGVTRTVFANDVGEYRLVGLPPGLGQVAATHAEHGTGRMSVRIKADPAGEAVKLPDLDVSPMVEISGTVENARGRPLAGAFLSATRISPYLALGSEASALGRSDENGQFQIEVGRESPLYLYAAVPGRAFGFSDAIAVGDQDRVSDVKVIVDREDKLPPDQQGTVLIALEDGPRGFVVYAVAAGSEAERSGFLAEDIVVKVDDVRPQDVEDARELLSGLPGSDLRVVVSRRGNQLELITSREGFAR